MSIKSAELLPLSNLICNEEFNSRLDGVGDIFELKESIKALGMLQPILGKKCLEGPNVEIYAGFRRLQAAQELELEQVPVIVTQASKITPKQMLLCNVAENLQRRDLNPVDEAIAMKRLHEEHSMAIEDVALELGVKKKHVQNRFKLLKLSEAIQKAVKEERITLKAAFEIDRLPEVLVVKYINLAEAMAGSKLSEKINKELEKLSAQTKVEGTQEKEEDVEPTTLKEHLRTLSTCTTIFSNALEYSATEQTKIKNVGFNVLEDEDIETLAKLLDGVAELLPDDVLVIDKAKETIENQVESETLSIDTSSEKFKQALIAGLMLRAQNLALEKTPSGKRPKVTYVLAREALEEIQKGDS